MKPNNNLPNSSVQDSTQAENNSIPLENLYPTDLPPENSTPKKTSQPSQNNRKSLKSLMIIFSCLSLTIISLIVAIVIIKNNQPNPNPLAQDDNEWTEEERSEYYSFQEKLNNIEKQATSMLQDKTSPNTAGVHELYVNTINAYLAENKTMNAMYSIDSAVKIFKNNIFPQDALQVYEEIDLLKFDQVTQYMLYRDAYNLATNLNNAEKIRYYNQKLTELEPVWEQYLEASKEASNNYEKELEELKKIP